MRQTKQKQFILDTFLAHNGHMTAEDLYNILKPNHPKLSLATVYRNLNQFAQLGLINKLDLPNHPTHFDITTAQHHHAICECCGKLIDIEMDQLPHIELIKNQGRFKATHFNLVVYGVCEDCQNQQATQASS